MDFDIGGAWDSFSASASDAYDAVADSDVGQAIGTIADDVGTGLGNAATDIGNGWNQAASDISTGYEQGDLLGGLGHAAGDFGDGLAHGAGDTYTGLSNGVSDGWNSLNSGVHDFGNTLQQGYTDGVNAFGSVIGDVAGQDVANAFTSSAMALEAPVQQAAQFGWGVTEGALEGTGGLVNGVADLAGGAYQYGTDSSYRDGVNSAVGGFAQSAWNDPLGTASNIGNGALNIAGHVWDGGVQAYQNGNLAEYIGQGVGYAVPLVAAAVFAPEAEVGELAGLGSEAAALTGDAAALTGDAAGLGDLAALTRTATTGAGDAAAADSSVSIYGFRGAGRTSDLLAEGAPHPYNVTGHVGYSLDGGNTIYGFGPSVPEGMPSFDAVRSLQGGNSYPGMITDDTAVFRNVVENPGIARGGSGSPQTVFEHNIPMTPQEFDAVQAAHDAIGLNSPQADLLYGFPNQNAFTCNCATFPGEQLGIPMPSSTGVMRDFMPELENVGHPWQPPPVQP